MLSLKRMQDISEFRKFQFFKKSLTFNNNFEHLASFLKNEHSSHAALFLIKLIVRLNK